MLDVGGGSGVTSIALARRNPHLRSCVLDIAHVCAVAQRNIDAARLGSRVTTRAGDIRDPLPPGHDVVMFCDVGVLPARRLRQAFHALPPGGLVVLADRYFSEDGTEPLDRLVHQLLHTSFPAATHREMAGAQRSCGFVKVVARNVYRDVWFLTGVKSRTGAGPPG